MEKLPSRILIIEDEPLIAFQLEDILNELGCTPIGPAHEIASALTMLATIEIDGAILDIDLDGVISSDVADELCRLGKPWIFMSGYGSEVLEGRYADVPLITKPFSEQDLSDAVTRMLGDQAPGHNEPPISQAAA